MFRLNRVLLGLKEARHFPTMKRTRVGNIMSTLVVKPVQTESGKEHISSELTHRYSVSAERLTQLVTMGQKRSQSGGQLYCRVRRMLKNALNKRSSHSQVGEWAPVLSCSMMTFRVGQHKKTNSNAHRGASKDWAHFLCELWVRTSFNLQYACFDMWRTVQYIWPPLSF